MRAHRGWLRIQASKQASIRNPEDVALSTLALKGEGIKVKSKKKYCIISHPDEVTIDYDILK